MAKEVYLSPLVRGSFVYLNEPRMPKKGDGKAAYSIDMMLDKDSPQHMKFFKETKRAVLALVNEKWGDPKVKRYKWTRPWKNGDKEPVEG